MGTRRSNIVVVVSVAYAHFSMTRDSVSYQKHIPSSLSNALRTIHTRRLLKFVVVVGDRANRARGGCRHSIDAQSAPAVWAWNRRWFRDLGPDEAITLATVEVGRAETSFQYQSHDAHITYISITSMFIASNICRRRY